MGELQKKQDKLVEDNSRSILLNDPRRKESNLTHLHIENKKRQRNEFDAIEVEKISTSVNDGSFLGLTQKDGNQWNNPHQIAGNEESCNDLNINKSLPEFEVDDEFLSDYSDIEMSPSPENRVLYPTLEIGKFVPVELKPVNPSSLVTNDPKNRQIDQDEFLVKKFPSPALCITPPLDIMRRESLLSKTQHGRVSLDDEGEKNFISDQQEGNYNVIKLDGDRVFHHSK